MGSITDAIAGSVGFGAPLGTLVVNALVTLSGGTPTG
ncbi:hypothetical protein SAMN05444583_10943 [Rhodococcus maanshanensis]|uniref:Uncharacterized protein n=1 Tax=Rhodococcus maanshanensis TaxID=183556 RepID=A0A1H7Q6K8_9NOCA|nr:hypothetical protein SAMN05444583_10943 [Rhodococcus maanshanensis]